MVEVDMICNEMWDLWENSRILCGGTTRKCDQSITDISEKGHDPHW